jgi:abequosyltransferase
MAVLSICIPTYNRSQCLSELLDSIIAQNVPDIEVVVSDDASPDNTVSVVQDYLGKMPNLKFLPQPHNLGLDRNFTAVTAAASGDYIWLMGDDDRLEPGGAQRVLDALARWPGVTGLTLGVIDYDVTMTHVTGVRATPETQLITGAGAVFGRIAELLGFMSAMVVDRKAWNSANADPTVRAMSNLYTQVYTMGLAVGERGQWGVVQEACVGFRSGNDQFKKKLGWFDRLRVDAEAYDEIADLLFRNDPAARRAMRKRVFNTHIMARIVNAKTSEDISSTSEAARYLVARYARMSRLWVMGLPILFAPSKLMRKMRLAHQRLNPRSGSARARRDVLLPQTSNDAGG